MMDLCVTLVFRSYFSVPSDIRNITSKYYFDGYKDIYLCLSMKSERGGVMTHLPPRPPPPGPGPPKSGYFVQKNLNCKSGCKIEFPDSVITVRTF